MSHEIETGENYGLNPCIICDEKVAVTHYTLSKTDEMTLKTLIFLKEYAPKVCLKCNFFLCKSCSDTLVDECACGGKITTYKEFSGLFFEKSQPSETKG